MIEPDNAAEGRMLDTILNRAATCKPQKIRSVNRTIRWLAPIAACLVIAVAIAVPTILSRNSQNPGDGISLGAVIPDNRAPGEPFASLDDCKGLSAGDYTWDEGDGISADRMLIGELRHLFYSFENQYGKPGGTVSSAIAIVRVTAVQPFTDPNSIWGGKGQIAYCEVVYDNILENDRQLPVHPQIKQYLYGGCTGDEETNLLRIGGVYVLPLTRYQSEFWNIGGDLDVLFEVDDNGIIHSHSRQAGFSKYDGQTLSLLWNDLSYLEQHPILYSRFAENISYDGYVEIMDNGLRMRWKNSEWNTEDTEGFSAKIIDGKITIETENFNVFRPFEGMTTDEMNTIISEIKQYLGENE